ncbi:MAG: hypothetical protein E4H36_11150 [Spirochaetales bacterium]|nr:MAG: hypothetical protein E4H36_11150 [Spirochaetales bacterium]
MENEKENKRILQKTGVIDNEKENTIVNANLQIEKNGQFSIRKIIFFNQAAVDGKPEIGYK